MRSEAIRPRGLDLTGRRFGRLLVRGVSGRRVDGHLTWECICDCGNTRNLLANNLLRCTRSCGCLRREVASTRNSGSPWNAGRTYAINGGERVYKTKHSWSKAAIRHFGGACQRCGWSKARCDVHHRIPRSKGGTHILRNAIVLCPNCHRVAHEGGGQ